MSVCVDHKLMDRTSRLLWRFSWIDYRSSRPLFEQSAHQAWEQSSTRPLDYSSLKLASLMMLSLLFERWLLLPPLPRTQLCRKLYPRLSKSLNQLLATRPLFRQCLCSSFLRMSPPLPSTIPLTSSRHMSSRLLPHAQALITTLLSAAQSATAVSSQAFTTISAVIEAIPTFVSSKQLNSILRASIEQREESDVSTKLLTTSAKKVPTKTLFPVVMDLWKDIQNADASVSFLDPARRTKLTI
jgi:hypothetical protein